MAGVTTRMIRAAKLDVNIYQEVEADESATGQALLVVFLYGSAVTVGLVTRTGIWSIVLGATELVIWFAWAFLTFFIGTKLIPSQRAQATRKGLIRAMGYATTPGLLHLFGTIPILDLASWYVASVWMLLATIIAVRETFAYSGIWPAVAVCVIGYVIVKILQQLLLAPVFSGIMA